MPYLIDIATGTPHLVSTAPRWHHGMWDCGDQRFVDTERKLYRLPAPTIGPNEFYFQWTMAEQVAIEEIRQVDPVVKLFMRRLDDPRTTEVVLGDPAVQGAVRHTVNQLVDKGVIAEPEAEDRIAAILAGPVK
jgi:hypothetical protein